MTNPLLKLADEMENGGERIVTLERRFEADGVESLTPDERGELMEWYLVRAARQAHRHGVASGAKPHDVNAENDRRARATMDSPIGRAAVQRARDRLAQEGIDLGIVLRISE